MTLFRERYADGLRQYYCSQVDTTGPYLRGGTEGRLLDPDAAGKEANLVSSEIAGTHMHRPVFDCDIAVHLVPTSTKDHYHLWFDKELSWEAYEEVMTVLGKHGLVDDKWVTHSINRKRGLVRPEGARKRSMAVAICRDNVEWYSEECSHDRYVNNVEVLDSFRKSGMCDDIGYMYYRWLHEMEYQLDKLMEGWWQARLDSHLDWEANGGWEGTGQESPVDAMVADLAGRHYTDMMPQARAMARLAQPDIVDWDTSPLTFKYREVDFVPVMRANNEERYERCREGFVRKAEAVAAAERAAQAVEDAEVRF